MSKLRLTVIFVDTWSGICEMEIMGKSAGIRKRIETIELTEEQSEKLQLKCVGITKGELVYDEIIEVIITDERN